MIPNIDTEKDVTLSVPGETIRACHRTLKTIEDTDDLPISADPERIDEYLREATRPDEQHEDNQWLVTMDRMEWVTLYGALYTVDDPADEQQQAMLTLIDTFPDNLTRLAEHTRDFYDAVQDER
jgi:nitrate reductase assembly molybdenum cofactor insertion protein NarJ